jgi:hypothetical protein
VLSPPPWWVVFSAKDRRLAYPSLQAAEKVVEGAKKHTSGAEARHTINELAARLKSCPSPKPRESEFFAACQPRSIAAI